MDYNGTIGGIKTVVDALEHRVDRRDLRVGIGIPGTISKQSGLVKNANSTWLIGRAFGHDLESALARTIRVENDANCLALSEARDGAATGYDPVFSAILGTGVGAGICVRGQLLTGPNGIAGEWGHNPLPWPTADDDGVETCYCGQTGCIETYLSGPGLAADYARLTGKSPTSVEEQVSGLEVAERVGTGELLARKAYERYVERLARALAHVINIIDPGVIVLGGGVSKMGSLYSDVPRIWEQWVFSDTVMTELKPAFHGDDSGVRGAAHLWQPGE